jgi:hypothetical protein
VRFWIIAGLAVAFGPGRLLRRELATARCGELRAGAVRRACRSWWPRRR